MFQAALLAFKNKKDNELTDAIEKGVLHQNGSSDRQRLSEDNLRVSDDRPV